MTEYLPVLIVGAIIGVFTVIFLVVYAMEQNKKDTMGFDRNMPDGEIIRRLMQFAQPHWKSFLAAFVVMLFSIVYNLLSPLLVGRISLGQSLLHVEYINFIYHLTIFRLSIISA